ncbi:hypothetical protein UCREL1_174 [Eutypa lata UCREL1]|uniref:Fungal N-terminal domain-containing protein n=1 Tax=Eutypa lata (strain UCR-EL1) TaxID=1287681 RepID=M7T802_EUTLA|nr:hypothetical protein UCREL1_174 [Eutypa lata UCREL1]
MDPLSIIAGIAGISQAGTSLSRAIYDVISSARGAPKEMHDIARGVSDLSIVLQELRRVLKEGREIYSRRLLRRVRSAGRRIGKIHTQIERLLDTGRGGIARLKWPFRKPKVTQLLYQIESCKSGINIILHIIVLAVQLKQLPSDENDNDNDNDRPDVVLARQQVENMVQDSYYSLRDVVETRSYTTPVPAEEEKEEDNDNADENSGGAAENQVEVWREQSNDTAMWLYDLVFSTAVEASRDTESTKTSDSPSPEALPHGQLLKEPSEASNTTLLALCQNTSMQQLQAMAQQPPPVKSVVSELLSEWTTLTEDEIEGTTAERKGKDSMAGIDRSNESGVIEDMVTFEDPKGRKFVFPFEVAKEWS